MKAEKARRPAANPKGAAHWTALGLALVALLGGAEQAWAQGPPINTQTAFVTGLQGAALRSFFFFTRRSGPRQDGRGIYGIGLFMAYLALPLVRIFG